VAAAYGLLAVFGNVGNFGLSMVEFRLGSEAVVAGTVYFLTVSTTAFIIGVALASWAQNGKATALFAVFKTPALLALWPALFFIVTPLEVPLFLTRITGLLANAMIPVMLVTLGTQLAAAGKLRFERDVLIASLIRLLGGPILAVLLADFFNLNDLTRYASILQASMPSAVLASIIAMEHDLLPDFVTKTVLISTVLSLFTLTFVLTFVIP
jgi:predicted permease